MTDGRQRLVRFCRAFVERASQTCDLKSASPRTIYKELLARTYRTIVVEIMCGRGVLPVTSDRPDNLFAGSLLWSPILACPDLARTLECVDSSIPRPDWKSVTGAELARTHEQLLGLEPTIVRGRLHLQVCPGNQRRTQGSYYSPPALVERLVAEVLQPKIATILAKFQEPETRTKALLALRICDPACGAGAFLLAGGWRLAAAIARQFHKDPTAEHVRKWLRQVAQQCLFGVDLDPLALALTQTCSWLEAQVLPHAGIPSEHLGFGNALLFAPHDHPGVSASKWQDDVRVAATMWPSSTSAGALGPTRADNLADNPEHDPAAAKVVREQTGAYHFLHWHHVFAEVFENGGFDLVVGNPPWERLKFQEKEFLAGRTSQRLPTAAARRRYIETRCREDAAFARELAVARARSADITAAIRANPTFKHSARGDINAYTLFVELGQWLLAPQGRLGMIVPSGLLTEATTSRLRKFLLQNHAIVAAYEFENLESMFPGVDRRFRFCLLHICRHDTRPPNQIVANYVLGARKIAELDQQGRRLALTTEEVARQSPQTWSIPIVRNRVDAELSARLHRLMPSPPTCERNSWGLQFTRLFDMSRDASLFCAYNKLARSGAKPTTSGLLVDRAGELWAPVYEGKMVDMLDHRAADIRLSPDNIHRPQQPVPLANEDKLDPKRRAQAFLWCRLAEVRAKRLAWDRQWLTVAKRVTSVTNSRTLRVAVIPWGDVALSYTLYAVTCAKRHHKQAPLVAACMCNLVTDYLVRQKTTQTSLTVGVLSQTPILGPQAWASPCPWQPEQSLADWASPILAKLVYTADATKAYAQDLNPKTDAPYAWNAREHATLLADLDAGVMAFLQLKPDEVGHILDTFPALHRRDQRAFGTPLTRQAVTTLHQQRLEESSRRKTL